MASGPLLARTQNWRIWYRNSPDSEHWFLGVANNRVENNVPSILWVKGSYLYSSTLRLLSVVDYKKRLGDTICEWDPRTNEGYESPTRRAIQDDAAKTQRKLGEKRIVDKYSKVKNVLQVGDVVHMQIPHKLRTKNGHTCLIGTVHELLPRQQYKVLTHAGLLTRNIPRNDLQYRDNRTRDNVGIAVGIENLPPVTEKEALMVMNPLRKMSVFCKCKKV